MDSIMKTISKIILALSVLAVMVSCGGSGDNGPAVSDKIVAEWHLVSVSGLSSAPQVYVDFAQDLSFKLYQQIGQGRYRKYEGTYTVSGSLLSGTYSDGKKWGSDYNVSFEGEKMALAAQNGSEEVCTYEKKALSEADKADAVLVTKSEEDAPRFL